MESNLKLNINPDDYVRGYQEPEETSELQRTADWREQRRGNWGSSLWKALMSCGQGTGKKTWNDKGKVFDFGKTVLKAIYDLAMQRRTGEYIDSGSGTKKMKYGTCVEPLIFAIAKKKLSKIGTLVEVGFKKFEDIPTAGVSADGVLKNQRGEIIAVYEAKATTNWGTHYDRTFDLMDDKGTDFWQTQAHMSCYKTTLCYYAVASPPTNKEGNESIDKYLYYEGDIMDLKEDFEKECDVVIKQVKASEMHQNAALKRIEISEEIIKTWNEDGGDLRKIMYSVIDVYKQLESGLIEREPEDVTRNELNEIAEDFQKVMTISKPTVKASQIKSKEWNEDRQGWFRPEKTTPQPPVPMTSKEFELMHQDNFYGIDIVEEQNEVETDNPPPKTQETLVAPENYKNNHRGVEVNNEDLPF